MPFPVSSSDSDNRCKMMHMTMSRSPRPAVVNTVQYCVVSQNQVFRDGIPRIQLTRPPHSFLLEYQSGHGENALAARRTDKPEIVMRIASVSR